MHDRQMSKYIQTKAKPPIFYLPALHTPESEQLLKESREKIEGQLLWSITNYFILSLILRPLPGNEIWE